MQKEKKSGKLKLKKLTAWKTAVNYQTTKIVLSVRKFNLDGIIFSPVNSSFKMS